MFQYGRDIIDYCGIGGYGGDVMFIVSLLFIGIIALLAYLIFKKPSSDNERLVKIEKDVEEIKETVKELKKKWDEIE
ncbi:hypothetical protein [Methanothermococcus thermolithotrophicus]|uniref:hypothetical protein n=1 Tax=Methanothermococcus thermolithotrophicus TaxID=2186 RepID=UPI00036C9A58